MSEAALALQIDKMMEGAPERGTPPASLDQIMKALAAMVDSRVPELDPDDDIASMSHVEGETRSVIILHPFSDDEEKHAVYDVMLPAVIEESRARCIGTVQAGWGIRSETREPDVRPSESPDREEFVIVTGCDGESYLTWMVPVARHEGASPTLGEWEKFDPLPVNRKSDPGWIMQATANALLSARVGRACRLWLLGQPEEWWTPTKREALVGMGSKDFDVVSASFKELYELTGDGLAPSIVAMMRRADFWDLPEPECDTPARALRAPR